jgi:hypothetical protein
MPELFVNFSIASVNPPNSPLVPTWLAVGSASVTMVALALHMNSLRSAEIPESRRRIRTVNGWLMLIAVPLLAYAFGIAAPAKTRLFVLVWAASVGLIGIIVTLAVLDMVNNWRLYHAARRRLRASALGSNRREHGAERAGVGAAADRGRTTGDGES